MEDRRVFAALPDSPHVTRLFAHERSADRRRPARAAEEHRTRFAICARPVVLLQHGLWPGACHTGQIKLAQVLSIRRKP